MSILTKIDHLGYACEDILSTIESLRGIYKIEAVSPIIFDTYQNANLCYVNVTNGPNIELVSGKAVENIVANGLQLYHTCYEVDDLQVSIDQLLNNGGTLVRPPYPAKLFNDRKVAFIATALGLVELLESEHLAQEKLQKQSICLGGTFNTEHVIQNLSKIITDLRLPLQFKQLDYNTVLQALYDKNSSFYQKNAAFNFILLRAADWLRFVKVDATIEDIKQTLEFNYESLVSGIKLAAEKNVKFIIGICPFSDNKDVTINSLLIEYSSKIKQGLVIFSNILFCDYILQDNSGAIYDQSLDKIGHLPYTELASYNLSLNIVRILHFFSRKPYKVVVVDCDNTLWDGVCAEDGTNNIKINPCNILLQQHLLSLKQRGFIICLCSKNEEADVLDVFFNRKDMPLQLDDIVAYKINWLNKSSNIIKLSKELQIDLEDFIFIDDNPMEIAEVSAKLPQVLCLSFPKHENEVHHLLNNAWCFDVLSSTSFDSKRSDFYKSNVNREKLRSNANSFSEFLEKLDLQIDTHEILETEFDRVAQLTKRTNQFNFTTKRRNVADIVQLINEKNYTIYTVSVKDRFSDYGLVGTIFFKIENTILTLDTFLLSCRVLGKGIEHKILNKIATLAIENGIKTIILPLAKTEKNKPALDFAENMPFLSKNSKNGFVEYKVAAEALVNFEYAPDYNEVIDSEVHTFSEKNNRVFDNSLIYKVLHELSKNKELIILKKQSKFYSKEEIVHYVSNLCNNLFRRDVSINDNFFTLGGDSLLALRIISRVKQEFNINLDLDDIFNYPVINDLIEIINTKLAEVADDSLYIMQKATVKELSTTQQWLWLLDQYDQGNSWYYNMPYVIRLRGKVNLNALEYALQQLIVRHEVLRLNIDFANNGYAIKFRPALESVLHVRSVRNSSKEELNNIIDSEYRKPFSLTTDLLFRSTLLEHGDLDYYLVIVNHHIVSDGWSYKIINNELSEYYQAYVANREPVLTVLKYDFFDYVGWHKEYLLKVQEQQMSFWRNVLHNMPQQNLPFDFSKNGVTHDGKYLPVSINPKTSGRLLFIARQNNISIFSLMIVIYGIQIAKLCNNEDIVILSPISGRQHPDAEELIGCFVNIVIFRLKIDLKGSLTANIQNNRDNIHDAFANQDIPFNYLLNQLKYSQDELDSSLFQVMFAFQNTNNGMVDFPDVTASLAKMGYDAARLDFILELEQIDDIIGGGYYYNTNLFSERTIDKYRTDFISLCDYVCDPSLLLDNYWKVTSKPSILKAPINYELPVVDNIVGWFETTVKLYPNNIAIKSGNNTLSYMELNYNANRLAIYLRNNGVKSNSIVAFQLEANNDSVVCILAILKLGATYLPIDTSAPIEYVRRILQDSGSELFICDNEMCKVGMPVLTLPIELSAIDHDDINNFVTEPGNIAYIIYTSGTTGVPKGVRIPHKNVIQLMASTQHEYKFDVNDVTLLFHSLAFDFSVWEMWLALCFGGKLVIPHRAQVKNTQEIYELIIDEKITVLNQTPTAFKQLCIYYENSTANKMSDLRMVIFGGEKLVPSDLLNFSSVNQHVSFYNMYGITETTVHTTIKRISSYEMTNTSNIGYPLPGRTIYLLDDYRNFVTEGEAGEIYVAGEGIADGYHRLTDKTKQVFVADILNPHHYMYKSGDLGRINNGELEYLGRKDKQVQLGGFRIELQGVEAILNQHPDVSSCAVNVINDNLLAIIIPKLNSFCITEDAKDLRTLPNGLKIHQLNANETDFLYDEIFKDNQYLSYGITLSDNACVLDVGANIGMFSILINQVVNNPKIYAFEPLPAVFKVLADNAKLYNNCIVPINMGLASVDKESTISYYEKMTIMSSMHADIDEDRDLISKHIAQKWDSQASTSAVQELIDGYLQAQQVVCKFTTLDSFIDKYQINKIDLLKVDVERNELDVLRGISASNWSIIQQCIIEVQGQFLNDIIALLELHGFACKTKSYDSLGDVNLYSVYASKDPEFLKNDSKMQPRIKYKWSNEAAFLHDVKEYIKQKLPTYMLPTRYKVLDKLPMNSSGKIDFSVFGLEGNSSSHQLVTDNNDLINYIVNAWSKVLGHSNIKADDSFFDIGGNSLLVIQAYLSLRERFTDFRMVDVFNYPTPRKLAAKFGKNAGFKAEYKSVINCKSNIEDEIAIIGYAGRFPQANDMDEYWQNLVEGKNCISYFTEQELRNFGVSEKYLSDPAYVKACGKIDDIDLFDAEFFGISAYEASLMDPQHRLFLELSWRALEEAGVAVDKIKHKVGIYAGMGHTHYLDSLYKHHDLCHTYGRDLLIELNNHKDYLANRVAYRLNLTGAAVNINTACSTSLVACVKACQSLLNNENDIVLAGGVSLVLPENYGYFYQAENVLSKDGTCKPFDKDAAGTVISSGAGVVVLKRLSQALQDGDQIKAIVKGFAINNDGNDKIGFAAPSTNGQASCIAAAHKMSKLTPQDITYIEAHGTGTKLGDPIEINSLSKIFGTENCHSKHCAIGAVKSNIGHADSAAGIAGLLKVVLMLQHKQIPPTLHYRMANEQIDFSQTPFYVNNELQEWRNDNRLYAGVSSFGVGGTNAHMILGNAPHFDRNINDDQEYLIILSAQHPDALEVMRQDLVKNFGRYRLNDLAYSLQIGRKDFEYRCAWIVTSENVARELDKTTGNIFEISESKLLGTAKNWLDFADIDWHALHRDKHHCKVPVPKHPFYYKRYWHTELELRPKFAITSVLDTLCGICAGLLGLADISCDKSFFAMGADSVLALSLIEQVATNLQVSITLDEIYASRDLYDLANLILSKNQIHTVKLKHLKDNHKSINMVIIHSLGGSLYCYDAIVNALQNCNVYGITNESLVNNMPDSIEKLAAQYIAMIKNHELKPPFVLLGWSFGGTVAYEMARQMLAAGIAVKHIFMLDTWCKFDMGSSGNEDYFKDLFNKRIMHASDTNWAKKWNQCIWERSKLIYRFKPEVSSIPTTLFKAKNVFPEFAKMEDPTNHWQTILGDTLSVMNLMADHVSIVDMENSKILAAHCDSVINSRDE